MAEDNVPIEINTAQLMHWLVTRRHIPQNWRVRLSDIRTEVNKAIAKTLDKEDLIKTLVIGGHNVVTYAQCQKILNFFRQSGEGTKNLLGQFKSQRTQDWADIVQLFKKDNMYLAENAHIIVTYAGTEIPAMKKDMNKMEQQLKECEKKLTDCDKSETASFKKFTSSCELLGIKGEEVRAELLLKIKELPQLYEELAKNFKPIQPAVTFYKAFIEHVSGQNIGFEIMPALIYVIEHGNKTTYEFVYGEAPLEIEEPKIAHIEENIATASDQAEEIDFGDQIVIESPKTTEHTISGGLSREVSNEESFEIIDYGDLDQEISISVEESGILVEKLGQKDGVARGEDAFTILDNPKYREEIIDNLSELEAFFKMRIFEMSHESELLLMWQLQNAPPILQSQTIESVTVLADCVNVALAHVTDKKIQHFHNIKHSPNYVDLLIETFNQYASAIERNKTTKNEVVRKMEQIRKEIKHLEVGIKWLNGNTKQMQKELEADLKERYKGRDVMIVGSVNTL